MNALDITLRDNKERFLPGAVVEGKATWQLSKAVDGVEIRLLWFTQGKGDRDISMEDFTRVENPALQDSVNFRFTLPNAPYSFSGKLISLIWAVEVVADGIKDTIRLEFSMAPDEREIVLTQGAIAQPQQGLLRR